MKLSKTGAGRNFNRTTMMLFTAALLVASGYGCHPARHSVATRPTPRPSPVKPATHNEPMDTIRWNNPVGQTPPPIGRPDENSLKPPKNPTLLSSYRLTVLLPFLTEQFDTAGAVIPDKSNLALQFYGGVQLALQQLSTESSIDLELEFIDAHANDEDFQQVLNSGRLDKAQVIIGPARSSKVQMLAKSTREKHQILISPISPISELTAANPDFIQTNPSLRAHCAAITRYVRRNNAPENIVLVCKESEADRLPYFQTANAQLGGAPMQQFILPDASNSFDKADFTGFFKAGKTTVFIMPSWGNQDLVMSFLRKLRAVKGSNNVEVYGMPQWGNFENIEPEYLTALNVHISSADYVDVSQPKVQDFKQKFFDTFGTVPDDNAFNGYDVMLFTGRMLQRYGLSFPEHLTAEHFEGFRPPYFFEPVNNTGALDDGLNNYDYLENTSVQMLRFVQYRFVPVNGN